MPSREWDNQADIEKIFVKGPAIGIVKAVIPQEDQITLAQIEIVEPLEGVLYPDLYPLRDGQSFIVGKRVEVTRVISVRNKKITESWEIQRSHEEERKLKEKKDHPWLHDPSYLKVIEQ